MATFGGKQPGAGRPKGALSKVTAKSKQVAQETGLLPHEWLLAVSRGEGIVHKRWVVKHDTKGKEVSRDLVEEVIYADFPTRIDASKAAAPFYAPKLAAQTVTTPGNPSGSNATADALKAIAAVLPV
tara:strand:- start:582 stop:962 length:381 start_codon:yes stop_codon:yes gene_type:complete